MIDEDELIADVTDFLSDLVADGSLELVATRHGPSALATELSDDLEEKPNLDLEEWLLERDEVVELYADAETLRTRVRPILHRLAKGDGEPKWNPDLAAAILKDPDDVHARLVFGDWLEQEGDPRGELIAVHAAIAEQKVPPRDDLGGGGGGGASSEEEHPLRRRESSLFERFRTHFFGSLTRDQKLTFRYGYFDTAAIDGHHVDELFELHSARFLQTLHIPFSAVKGAEMLAAMKATLPPSLTEVKVGIVGRTVEPGKLTIGATSVLLSLPKLDVLEYGGEHVALETLELPTVRVLGLHAQSTLTFARETETGLIDLRSLEELTLDAPTLTDPAGLRALIASPPPKLKILRLQRLRQLREILQILADKPALLKQLDVFDVRKSNLTRNDARFFVENKPLFAHLERLDLRGNYGVDSEAVRNLCKDVATGSEGLREEGGMYDDEDGYDEDEDYDDEEDEDYSDPDYDDPSQIPNEDAPTDDDDAADDEADEEAEPEEGGVDRDAPMSERERYDEPVE